MDHKAEHYDELDWIEYREYIERERDDKEGQGNS